MIHNRRNASQTLLPSQDFAKAGKAPGLPAADLHHPSPSHPLVSLLGEQSRPPKRLHHSCLLCCARLKSLTSGTFSLYLAYPTTLYHPSSSRPPDARTTLLRTLAPRDFSALAFNDPSLFTPYQSRVLHHQWQLLSPYTPATALSPPARRLAQKKHGHCERLGWMMSARCYARA